MPRDHRAARPHWADSNLEGANATPRRESGPTMQGHAKQAAGLGGENMHPWDSLVDA